MIRLYHGTYNGAILVETGATSYEKAWRKLRTMAKNEKRSQNREAQRRRGYDVKPTGWMGGR